MCLCVLLSDLSGKQITRVTDKLSFTHKIENGIDMFMMVKERKGTIKTLSNFYY